MIGSNFINHFLLQCANIIHIVLTYLLDTEIEMKMYIFTNKPIQKRYYKRISLYEITEV